MYENQAVTNWKWLEVLQLQEPGEKQRKGRSKARKFFDYSLNMIWDDPSWLFVIGCPEVSIS